MLNDVLAGTKGWFLWNGSSLGLDWDKSVRHLMTASGAQALALKTYDGTDGFTQPFTLPDLREVLDSCGPVVVGAWGYHYGDDVEGEIQQVRHALKTLRADFVILNVEDTRIERDPETADKWSTGLASLRADWPLASLYFCSHAQPGYHEKQPYWQASEAELVQMPMIYHTAMRQGPAASVGISHVQFEDFSLMDHPDNASARPWSAAGAAYGDNAYPIIPADILRWGEAAVLWGATSLIWWDLDTAIDRPDILEAVRQCVTPAASQPQPE